MELPGWLLPVGIGLGSLFAGPAIAGAAGAGAAGAGGGLGSLFSPMALQGAGLMAAALGPMFGGNRLAGEEEKAPRIDRTRYEEDYVPAPEGYRPGIDPEHDYFRRREVKRKKYAEGGLATLSGRWQPHTYHRDPGSWQTRWHDWQSRFDNRQPGQFMQRWQGAMQNNPWWSRWQQMAQQQPTTGREFGQGIANQARTFVQERLPQMMQQAQSTVQQTVPPAVSEAQAVVQQRVPEMIQNALTQQRGVFDNAVNQFGTQATNLVNQAQTAFGGNNAGVSAFGTAANNLRNQMQSGFNNFSTNFGGGFGGNTSTASGGGTQSAFSFGGAPKFAEGGRVTAADINKGAAGNFIPDYSILEEEADPEYLQLLVNERRRQEEMDRRIAALGRSRPQSESTQHEIARRNYEAADPGILARLTGVGGPENWGAIQEYARKRMQETGKYAEGGPVTWYDRVDSTSPHYSVTVADNYQINPMLPVRRPTMTATPAGAVTPPAGGTGGVGSIPTGTTAPGMDFTKPKPDLTWDAYKSQYKKGDASVYPAGMNQRGFNDWLNKFTGTGTSTPGGGIVTPPVNTGGGAANAGGVSTYTGRTPDTDLGSNVKMKRGGMVKKNCYAEGGLASIDSTMGEDRSLIEQAAMALMGQSPDPERVLMAFREKFGEKALADLAQRVKAMMAQQSDGSSDMVPAQLSEGEYVVPADVVSHMGNGSTDAGGKKLDQMVERARTSRGASAGMPPRMDHKKVMPV